MIFKVAVWKSFRKFTGKHPWQILFYETCELYRNALLLKYIFSWVVSCEFWKIFRIAIVWNTWGQPFRNVRNNALNPFYGKVASCSLANLPENIFLGWDPFFKKVAGLQATLLQKNFMFSNICSNHFLPLFMQVFSD